MYIKFNERDKAQRFTFFKREITNKDGEKIAKTDKAVYGTLSEGIKVGNLNGKDVWENDYWNAVFCGKAYEKALNLEDKTRICVVEMNVRNKTDKTDSENIRSYPSIVVTDFDIFEK